jgi:hypothetical protein
MSAGFFRADEVLINFARHAPVCGTISGPTDEGKPAAQQRRPTINPKW